MYRQYRIINYEIILTSFTHLYSPHDQMQLIDVFVHVYISRFLINIEKKRKH